MSAIYNLTPPTLASGQSVGLQADAAGNLKTRPVAPGGAGGDGFSNANVAYTFSDTGGGTFAALAPWVFNGTTWDRARGDTNGSYVVPKPVTSGGLTPARLVASVGANIKASAGQLYGGVVTNSNAAIRFLHLYNKASAATLSTDTPVATFALPPNASVQITTDGLGEAFAAGISWAFTTDNIAIPTAAGATTDLHGTLFFK